MYNSDGYNNDGQNGYYGNQYQQRQRPQVQIGGFAPVPSEMDARRYPMAPWTKMVFLNTNAPFCYTKTRYGREEPEEFHIFRDVDFFPHQPQQQQQQPAPQPQQQAQGYDMRHEMEALEQRVTERIDALAAALTPKTRGGKQNENA